MSRPYSDKFMMHLMDESREDTLGTSLAKLCITAKIPAKYAADALGVSKLTIYSWFRGNKIRVRYHGTIKAFMDLIDKDLEAGVLPAKDPPAAKAYISSMVGREI